MTTRWTAREILHVVAVTPRYSKIRLLLACILYVWISFNVPQRAEGRLVGKFFSYIRSEKRPASESGINDSYWLYHRSLARKINLNPFLLANEWVCSNVGWHMRLPIPPFALMRKGGSPRFFASLDFDGGETKAPDMDARKLATAMPREATGVVVFDIFIANPDRHEGNLKVDNVDLPTRIEVFDQDYAFWGHNANCGATRLQHVWNRLGLSKGLTNTDFHKLAPYLSSSDLIGEWCNKVYKISDQFIEDICTEAKELGLNTKDIETGIAFLKDRKAKLEDIIKQNKAFFPLITTWGSI